MQQVPDYANRSIWVHPPKQMLRSPGWQYSMTTLARHSSWFPFYGLLMYHCLASLTTSHSSPACIEQTSSTHLPGLAASTPYPALSALLVADSTRACRRSVQPSVQSEAVRGSSFRLGQRGGRACSGPERCSRRLLRSSRPRPEEVQTCRWREAVLASRCTAPSAYPPRPSRIFTQAQSSTLNPGANLPFAPGFHHLRNATIPPSPLNLSSPASPRHWPPSHPSSHPSASPNVPPCPPATSPSWPSCRPCASCSPAAL